MCAIDASLKGFFQAWGNPLIGIFMVRRKRLKGKNEVRIVRRDGARRHCVPSRDMRPTQSRAARRREKKPKPPLDAEAAAAFVLDRAGRAEGAVRVAFKGVELRDSDALSATLDAAARLRVSTLNLRPLRTRCQRVSASLCNFSSSHIKPISF